MAAASSYVRESKPALRSLALPFALLALLLSGCTIIENATHTLVIEPFHFPRNLNRWDSIKLHRNLARRYLKANCPWATADYRNGFEEGFVDYLTYGGDGRPPILPPREYWRLNFRTPEGYQATTEWFNGWEDGVAAAQASGYREFATVPSSLLMGHGEVLMHMDEQQLAPAGEPWLEPNGEPWLEPPAEPVLPLPPPQDPDGSTVVPAPPLETAPPPTAPPMNDPQSPANGHPANGPPADGPPADNSPGASRVPAIDLVPTGIVPRFDRFPGLQPRGAPAATMPDGVVPVVPVISWPAAETPPPAPPWPQVPADPHPARGETLDGGWPMMQEPAPAPPFSQTTSPLAPLTAGPTYGTTWAHYAEQVMPPGTAAPYNLELVGYTPDGYFEQAYETIEGFEEAEPVRPAVFYFSPDDPINGNLIPPSVLNANAFDAEQPMSLPTTPQIFQINGAARELSSEP